MLLSAVKALVITTDESITEIALIHAVGSELRIITGCVVEDTIMSRPIAKTVVCISLPRFHARTETVLLRLIDKHGWTRRWGRRSNIVTTLRATRGKKNRGEE
jgi:hypothetical protein